MNEFSTTERATAAPRPLAKALEAFRRRRKPMFVAFAIVFMAAMAVTFFWPASYQSTGIILIEQQELPTELVQSTITSFADQRIQVISQRVMTTDNLLQIIQRYDLYPELRKNKPREIVLEKMRSNIHFAMISADVMDPRQGRATKANIAFSVSFESPSAEMAARVANELITLYLNENVKSRRQSASNAATFLDDEAGKLSANIDEIQARIAKFKNEHLNSLPDSAVLNSQVQLRTEEELRDVDTQLRSLDQQSTYLEAQLAQISPSSQVYTSTGERVLSPEDRLKFLRTEYARVSGIYAPTHPDVMRIKREIEGLEKVSNQADSSNDMHRQLDDARTQLASAKEHYGPDHPDVLRLSRLVASLTQSLHDLPGAQQPEHARNPDNPAYIEVKAQREAAMAQRSSLQTKREQLQAMLGRAEARLAALPAVERDYNDLLRELENSQIKYREVRQKQMGAKLAENLEDEQKGERFTLIDPPLTPQLPESPNRWLIGILGVVLALMAGAAAAYVLESRDDSVRNRADLERLLNVAPLAILPRFVTNSERVSRRRHRMVALVGAGVGAVALLALTHYLYRPLDVLWEIALRKLGG